MRLDRIQVTHYRNIPQAVLEPKDQLTVLWGENGQGKTNLLESIWLLTGGKSFRGSKDQELILRGESFGVIEASFHAQGRDQQLRLTIGGKDSPRPGRRAVLNGVDRGRAASVAGILTAVVFCPEHLRLVKGSPEGRRKFLDVALCQLYPGYLATLRRYTRTMTQKNALLKQYEITPDAGNLLDVFNRSLAQWGEELTLRRMEYLDQLRMVAGANYRDLSGGRESLEIQYLPSFQPGKLYETMTGLRDRELGARCSLAGPHREDMEFLLSGQPAKVYASQGQQRSAVLALKLGETAMAAKVTGEHPVMLLDDVLSELDEGRQSYLLTRMEEKQTFVTTCDPSAFSRTQGALFLVEQGSIREA